MTHQTYESLQDQASCRTTSRKGCILRELRMYVAVRKASAQKDFGRPDSWCTALVSTPTIRSATLLEDAGWYGTVASNLMPLRLHMSRMLSVVIFRSFLPAHSLLPS